MNGDRKVSDGKNSDRKNGDRKNGEPPIDPGLEPLIQQAVTDLAERLSVAIKAISVDQAVLTTWSDRGFLGGIVGELRQTQIPADGCEIVLSCPGHDLPGPYRYRTGGALYRPTLHFADRHFDARHFDARHLEDQPSQEPDGS